MKNTQVNPIFSWDEETGIASCILYNKANNKTYLGIAQCHTDDFDMMNEKTGCNIAFLRAKIKAFQSYKNDELTPDGEKLLKFAKILECDVIDLLKDNSNRKPLNLNFRKREALKGIKPNQNQRRRYF